MLKKFLTQATSKSKKKGDSPDLVSYNYSDFSKTSKEKIDLEKRRRNQVYMTLDYILSNITYFDFFSTDAFNIVKYSKYFAQICKKKIVTSELLLLPFFDSKSELSLILENHGMNKKTVGDKISSLYKSKSQPFFEKNIERLKSILKKTFKWNPIVFDTKIKYSYEINNIFEKSAENALMRFKTPVITSEILFITMMEQNSNRIGKFVKKFLLNDTEWYLLRYKLIKRIHIHESMIRSEVPSNQQYFAYLLKTQLPDIEFSRLIESEYLPVGVSVFRNTLITEILKIDLSETLDKDIHKSIKISSKRIYSS